MKPTRRLIAVAILATLYAASMFLPVVDPIAPKSHAVFAGYDAFEIGWRSLYMPGEEWDRERLGLATAWMANPALYISLVCLVFSKRFYAMLCAGVACLLAIAVLPDWWKEIHDLPGYWFWWGSMVAALLSAVFLLKCSPRDYAEDFGPMKIPPTPSVP